MSGYRKVVICMDLNKAFNILVLYTGKVKEDRDTHHLIEQALDVIKAAISTNQPAEQTQG